VFKRRREDRDGSGFPFTCTDRRSQCADVLDDTRNIGRLSGQVVGGIDGEKLCAVGMAVFAHQLACSSQAKVTVAMDVQSGYVDTTLVLTHARRFALGVQP
jgi:hypothetical protein